MPRPSTGQLVEWTCRDGSTSFGVRFRAYGKRRYVTLGNSAEGMTRRRAQLALDDVISDVRRGIWRPDTPQPAPAAERESPTFHTVATEYVRKRRHEVDPRTVEHWLWALDTHLVPHFGRLPVTHIGVAQVEAYKTAKLEQRQRDGKGLSNGSINKTLKVLGQVLDDAIDLGHLTDNAARGRKRRLKAARPRRTWLELDEVRAVLDAAGDHRALLATMILAGLRVGELIALRWRDVDLARGKLTVADAKTDAGRRDVDLTPDLLGELKLHRAAATDVGQDGLVFPTSVGTARGRSNILRDVLRPAVKAATATRVELGLPPIQDGVTNHTLRRTFASLLYEAGASPAYVMAQMGHTDAALALEVYSKVVERSRDTGVRMDALVRGADWAGMGRSEAPAASPLPVEATKSPV